MARDRNPPAGDGPAWDRVMRLFLDGSPEFVAQIRLIVNADRLAPFAEKWYADTRAEARRLLVQYLEQPLNAPRHEPLVKRLFKLAEKSDDDTLMARFLVALDRTVRRRHDVKRTWNSVARTVEETPVVAAARDTTLPRADRVYSGSWFVQNRDKYIQKRFLFSLPTRRYLRRRAWRYFRKLGQSNPDRYVPAVGAALALYTDADVPDGLGLLDNWGLCHILFHYSPTLKSTPRGWTVAPNGTLSQLQPDPIYRKLWLANAEPVLDLLAAAKSRPVALWCAKMLRRHFPDRLARVPVEELLNWLVAENAVLNDLAIELLERAGGLDRVPLAAWLKLLETARPELLDRISALMIRAVKPEQVSFAEAVRLAMQRPVPLARLGQTFLANKTPASDDEIQSVFGLREAEAEPLRADLVKWACKVLGGRADFHPLWTLEFLDSRHADVRAVGWEWLLGHESAREDVQVWQRLLESPHDDIRTPLVRLLEDRLRAGAGRPRLSPERVRSLWAAVLLNIHRGSRAKPFVVRQVMTRLAAHPDEAGELLPIVAVALRSIRGPEFRAGLAGVATFVEHHPARRPLVEAVFPELSWN